MLLQLISDWFFNEFRIILYYIIIILCEELAVFFLLQRRLYQNRSPKWMLAFSVWFAFSGVMELNRALIALVYTDDAAMVAILNNLNLFLAALEALLITHFASSFFKIKGKKLITPKIIKYFCAGTCVMNALLLLGVQVEIIAIPFSGITLFIAFLLPTYLIIQLVIRAEKGSKTTFLILFISLITTILGILLQSQFVEERVINLIPASMRIWYSGGALLLIMVSLGIVAACFFYLPAVEEFFWKYSILGAYIIDRQKNQLLFKHVFASNITKQEEVLLDENLETVFLGGISSINDLIREIVHSQEKNIEFIDQGNIKLIMNHNERLIFILVATRFLPIMKWKLYNFMETFMFYYGDSIDKIRENSTRLHPIDQLLVNTFDVNEKVPREKSNE
ncbi:hypothetical protein GF325_12575 [Candidatus Bathyarchaeota archaeon]|nr:hypothetical protein [Candidatus Bathyarchaeota archaeon]